MPSIVIPSGFSSSDSGIDDASRRPAVTLRNATSDSINVHFVTDGIARVVFCPGSLTCTERGFKPVVFERSEIVPSLTKLASGAIRAESEGLSLLVEYGDGAPRLSWRAKTSVHAGGGPALPVPHFHRDCCSRAYSYDSVSGAVAHYVERELWLPLSEDDEPSSGSDSERFGAVSSKDEYVYGLGETTGGLVKGPRKFTLEPRDSLGYDPTSGDGMYKVSPFYLVYKKSQNLWFGIFYNTLTPSVFDMGSETDALFGSFRSFRASAGPLDYYVILSDGTLPSIITAFAKLVTPVRVPSHPSPPTSSTGTGTSDSQQWSASPVLPPLSQFGYLASSLGLAARHDAQQSIIDFVRTCRGEKGLPVDGLHLSSGWCQDEETGVRNVFEWNKTRYPDPTSLGRTLEGPDQSQSLDSLGDTETETDVPPGLGGVKIITNVKPWVLDVHPSRRKDGSTPDSVFVQSAASSDTPVPVTRPEKSILWSSGLGDHAVGSYIDYSSKSGAEWWKQQVTEQLLDNHFTGAWIDNNEFSGLVDDEATFRGEISFWSIKESESDGTTASDVDVDGRMGWGGGRGPIAVGRAGKTAQAMGMAKATYEALLAHAPDSRPVIVSRSGVPGIQAFAHGSWSGDNTTTWSTLRHSTALTLNVGVSFGTGLYGHDIGGFAPSYLSPSPELLVRWVQHGAWHTRFVVHSWKEVETTLWMYDGVQIDRVDVGKAIRDAVRLRYQLAPTFYSLYVTHYHRLGWPVLKPMMWYHSDDPVTLALEEQFIFGSHVLIAPVVEKLSRYRQVYLPSVVNGDASQLWWCEYETGIWHRPQLDAADRVVKADAPIDRTPVYVRGGGILVLGGVCANTIYDGSASRLAYFFPAPTSSLPSPPKSCLEGSFTLIEDDGRSNGHTHRGVYTEIVLSFRVIQGEEDVVAVDYQVIRAGYRLPFGAIEIRLPEADQRRLVGVDGKILQDLPPAARCGSRAKLVLNVPY